MLRLWILKILDGLFTLLGEIIVFFGAYSFITSYDLRLIGAGLFLVLLGQMAGINAVRYEGRKKLRLIYLEVMEDIGRQFAYPLLIFALYVLDRSQVFLALAFALALVAVLKSFVIVYKARVAEAVLAG